MKLPEGINTKPFEPQTKKAPPLVVKHTPYGRWNELGTAVINPKTGQIIYRATGD